VLDNHDQPRVASRIGAHQARVAAMLLFTLPGTLTMYYGEEIGMTNVPIAPEDVQDPAEKNEPGIGAGRDPERTPCSGTRLHWPDSRPAVPGCPSHSTTPPPTSPRRTTTPNPSSIFIASSSVYALPTPHSSTAKCNPSRRAATSFDTSASAQTKTLLILLNLSHEPVQVDASGIILKSTHGDREGEHVLQSTTLRPAEGLILET
jgi:alpha-glucosidase